MDATRTQVGWQRWYVAVSLGIWMLALCASVAAAAWMLLGWPDIAIWFTATAGWLMAAMVVWQAWVFPWFRAADGPSGTAESPQRELRDMRFVIWLPAIGLVALCLTLTLAGPMLEYFDARRWMPTPGASWGLVAAAAIGPVCAWSWWYSRHVSRRFRQRTAAAALCFACGYDLRGTPGQACPECGCNRETAQREQASPTARGQ